LGYGHWAKDLTVSLAFGRRGTTTERLLTCVCCLLLTSNETDQVQEIVVKQFRGGLNYRWNPKVPKEVRIMKLMNKTHCRGVVRLRAYRRYCHKKVHRLYLRYCPYGDLRRLIDRYRRFRQVDFPDQADGLALTVVRRYLPEAFLWEVFYYLADAADAMANGPEKGPDDDDDTGWDFQVVHMDIKPDNSQSLRASSKRQY